jgi:hypothetical protein
MLKGDELFMLNNITRKYADDHRMAAFMDNAVGHQYDCHRSDIVQQFFLASVEMLTNSGWYGARFPTGNYLFTPHRHTLQQI